MNLPRFFASGGAVDLVLLVIVAEFFLLCRPAPGRLTIIEATLALGPGACLLLALRAALVGADWRWVAAALLASFPLHLADLARRRVRGSSP